MPQHLIRVEIGLCASVARGTPFGTLRYNSLMLPGPGKRGHGFGDVDYIEQIDREDTMRILPNIGANLAIAMLSGASIVASSGEAHATGRNFDPGLQVAIIVCPIIPHENSHGLEARIGAPTKLISGELAEFNGETCADALAKIKGGLNGHCSTAGCRRRAGCDMRPHNGTSRRPTGSHAPIRCSHHMPNIAGGRRN